MSFLKLEIQSKFSIYVFVIAKVITLAESPNNIIELFAFKFYQ